MLALLAWPVALAGTGQNVLLIVADDLGVDKVGAFASDADPDYPSRATALPQTPVLDQLADAGVRFSDAWANPNCSPTRASLQTGQHPMRHGVGAPDTPDLDLSATTLAHVATDAGYSSGLFGKWHLGEGELPAAWAEGESWTDYLNEFIAVELPAKGLGYPAFFGTISSIGDAGYYDWLELRSVDRWNAHAIATERTSYATEVTTDRALNWIDKRTGPWLAVVNYHAPHGPLEAPPSGCGYTGDTSSDLATFQAMTECLDMEIGRLLDGIGDLHDTVVIFMADNGSQKDIAEDLFDDGQGKGSVYETGLRVPLIITDGKDWLEAISGHALTGPNIVGTPGTVVTDPVHTTDLFATIADIMGGDDSTGTDSHTLTWATRFGSLKSPRSVYSEQYRSQTGAAALRSGDWKLIVQASPVMGCRTSYELYDLATDRFEATDLSATEPTQLTAMIAELDTLVSGQWLDLPDCS